MFATQRLYLTADKSRLVAEGDPEAATLYASPGDEIPDSAVQLFGLVDGALPDGGAPAAKPKAAAKGKAKAATTKEAAPAEDKSNDGQADASAPADTPAE